MLRSSLFSLAVLASLVAAPAASAGIFGTEPLQISLKEGAPPNGGSGGAAVSGDDRSTRHAAFHSDASNLVAGDTNGATDVFLWDRPRGSAGLTLSSAGSGLQRVSVASGGGQANGASTNPSLDGSVRSNPRYVAFQSQASNLASSDRDATSDIFVRDFKSGRTIHVSDGIRPAATDPSISGDGKHVAFAAGGRVYVAPVGSGRTRSLGRGSNPDFSLDGSAVTWEKGSSVWVVRGGRKAKVGPGQNPTVSDKEDGLWGVSFESKRKLARGDGNPGWDVYMRVLGARGGVRRTDLISAQGRGGQSLGGDNYNGGLTAYAPKRGILTFLHSEGSEHTVYYRNNNSGNIDDLAHMSGPAAIKDVVTSARANFIAFTGSPQVELPEPETETRYTEPVEERYYEEPYASQAPVAGQVFFKHLIDGKAL